LLPEFFSLLFLPKAPVNSLEFMQIYEIDKNLVQEGIKSKLKPGNAFRQSVKKFCLSVSSLKM
jgi:hypothetical protein